MILVAFKLMYIHIYIHIYHIIIYIYIHTIKSHVQEKTLYPYTLFNLYHWIHAVVDNGIVNYTKLFTYPCPTPQNRNMFPQFVLRMNSPNIIVNWNDHFFPRSAGLWTPHVFSRSLHSCRICWRLSAIQSHQSWTFPQIPTGHSCLSQGYPRNNTTVFWSPWRMPSSGNEPMVWTCEKPMSDGLVHMVWSCIAIIPDFIIKVTCLSEKQHVIINMFQHPHV